MFIYCDCSFHNTVRKICTMTSLLYGFPQSLVMSKMNPSHSHPSTPHSFSSLFSCRKTCIVRDSFTMRASGSRLSDVQTEARRMKLAADMVMTVFSQFHLWVPELPFSVDHRKLSSQKKEFVKGRFYPTHCSFCLAGGLEFIMLSWTLI